jgi:hypothetical protein
MIRQNNRVWSHRGPSRRVENPKTEIEPRMARMGTDYERVMETILKPVRCILKSVEIRAIRGQNSNESPCNFGVPVENPCSMSVQLSDAFFLDS